MPHALLAAVLSHEGAIGVRSGCFCAHTYVKELLRVKREEELDLMQDILSRDRSRLPGMIRMSFGLYNTLEEVDRFAGMIRRIAAGEYEDGYVLNKEKGEYTHPGLVPVFEEYYEV